MEGPTNAYESLSEYCLFNRALLQKRPVLLSILLQSVPWKMRLEIIVEMQIEILNGGEILVN